MTKRERVAAAAARQPVDRPPVSLWRHVPYLDHDPGRLADAMLAFQARWGLDFIKVMSSGVYCVEDWGCKVDYKGAPNGAKQCTEHGVTRPEDWRRLAPLDPGAGALGRELEAVHRIAKHRDDDVPVVHTLFSPLTIARKLAGDALGEHMRQQPDAVRAGLETITATLRRYAATAFEAGADGIFLAMQTATPEVCAEAEFAEWDLPLVRRVLDGVRERSTFSLLHLHGQDVYFDRLAALPADAINWHDRVTTPTLTAARDRFAGALVGGIDEWRTLRQGTPAAIADEVREAVRQTGGVGHIVAPGCVVPLDVRDDSLAAVMAAVRTPAAR